MSLTRGTIIVQEGHVAINGLLVSPVNLDDAGDLSYWDVPLDPSEYLELLAFTGDVSDAGSFGAFGGVPFQPLSPGVRLAGWAVTVYMRATGFGGVPLNVTMETTATTTRSADTSIVPGADRVELTIGGENLLDGIVFAQDLLATTNVFVSNSSATAGVLRLDGLALSLWTRSGFSTSSPRNSVMQATLNLPRGRPRGRR